MAAAGLSAAAEALRPRASSSPSPPFTVTTLEQPPEPMQKAGPGKAMQASTPAHEPTALYLDPYAVYEALGYRNKPSGTSFDILRLLPMKVAPVGAIIHKRVNDIGVYCKPAHERLSTGYQVRPRDRDAEMSPADRKRAAFLEEGIRRGSFSPHWNGYTRFRPFVQSLARDSLVLDQMCFEKIPDRRGLPCTWLPTDAATIRLADTAHTFPAWALDPTIPRTVQVFDTQITHEYLASQMAFHVRNPRTDLRNFGYGYAESEMMLETLIHLLWGDQHNAGFFRQGFGGKGLLHFKGEFSDQALNEFRHYFHQTMSGVLNAFRTPVIRSSAEMQYVPLHVNNRDMEFGSWYDYKLKVACAFFLTNPIEINFNYGNTGQTSAMNGDSGHSEKMADSKSRGLTPLLSAIGDAIDEDLIQPLDPEWGFFFVGQDAPTPQEHADLMVKRVGSTHTLDEVRKEIGLKPMTDDKAPGNIILNAVWQAAMSQAAAAQAAAEQQDADGADLDAGDDNSDIDEMDLDALVDGDDKKE